MAHRLLVINPNSTTAVTERMSAALDGFRFSGGPQIDCQTLVGTPTGIQTEGDRHAVVGPLLESIKAEEHRTGAFIVACYSDPGLTVAQEATRRPVIGIGRASLSQAILLGSRFGIIASLETSLAYQVRAVREASLSDRFVGNIAIGKGAAHLDDDADILERLVGAGQRLKTDRADVVIMGCAGMARFRSALETKLGLPVVEPAQAAVAFAIGLLAI